MVGERTAPATDGERTAPGASADRTIPSGAGPALAALAGAERALALVGRWLVTAGRFAGRQAAAGYRAVDPDVRRHLAQLPLLSYSLFGARSERVTAGTADGHAPLVFVHGLGGSRGDFLLMAKYLWLHGRKRSYRVGLAAGHSLEETAAALARFVREVVAATGEPEVEIVAHSLGGVVAHMALVDCDLAPLVRTLITLGSPHGGTYAARFADTAVTRALRPDSPLVRRLAESRWPVRVHGVSFWSKSDMLVLPSESAALDGTDQIEVTPFTHYSYLIDPRSWALVRGELELGARGGHASGKVRPTPRSTASS